MSDRETPDYLELFPQLAMVEVARSPRRVRYVTWLDQMRDEIGSAEVRWEETRFRLHYHFHARGSGLPDVGFREFRVDVVARGSHGYRFNALCRTCGKYVSRLSYRTEDWLCQKCQGLNHRSTFIPAQQRWQEEYDGLRYLIKHGRPPGMREKAYMKMRDRMSELAEKLDGSGRRPGRQFDRCVFAEWSDTDPEA